MEPIVLDFRKIVYPEMDPQLRFFFGAREGKVALGYGFNGYWKTGATGKKSYDHEEWKEKLYPWPVARYALQEEVRDYRGRRVDVYICPTLRVPCEGQAEVRSRKHGDGRGLGQVLWADLDHDDDIPQWLVDVGAGVVSSGSEGHRHLYVPCGEWLDGKEITALNKELARQLRGDKKYPDNSLLRLAGTRNYKDKGVGGRGSAVTWLTLPRKSRADLAVLRKRLASTPSTQKHVPAAGPVRKLNLRKYPRVMKALAVKAEEGARSEAVYSLVNHCVHAGLSVSQTVAVVETYGPAVGHHKGNLARLRARTAEEWEKCTKEKEETKTPDLDDRPKGKPGHKLSELLKVKLSPLKWVIPELIVQPGLTVLVGDPKAGKSFLALNILIAIATGRPVMGKVPAATAPCLYASCEDGDRRIQGRALKFLDGEAYAGEEVELWYEWGDQDEEGNVTLHGYHKLDEYLAEHPRVKFVVIDTWIAVRGDRTSTDVYGEDYSSMKKYQRLAHKHDVAILMLHHSNSSTSTGDWARLSNGSQGIGGAADTQMHLFRDLDDNGTPLNTGRLYVKGRDVEPKSINMVFDSELERWEMVESTMAYLFRPGSTKRLIANYLAEHAPQFPKQIAEATDLRGHTIRVTLGRMQEEGYVVLSQSGWRISSAYAGRFAPDAEEEIVEL